MIIKELKINSFGNIKDKTITFNDGLNLIFGNNESGKTTILTFIRFVIYGGQGRVNPVKNYFPLDLSSPSGELTVETDGIVYTIKRNGVKKKGNYATVVSHKDGEVISGDKAESFLYDMVGMDEDMFVSTHFVKDISDSTMLAKEELLKRLDNLSSIGDENISFNEILSQLEDEKLSIISPRRKDAVVPALEKELMDVEAAIGECSGDSERYNEVQNELNEACSEQSTLKKIIDKYDKDDFESDVKRYNDEYRRINDEIIDIEKKRDDFFKSVTHEDIENYKKEEKALKSLAGYLISTIILALTIVFFVMDYMSLAGVCIASGVLGYLLVTCKKRKLKNKLMEVYGKAHKDNLEDFCEGYKKFNESEETVSKLKETQKILSLKIENIQKNTNDKKNILTDNMNRILEINSRKNRLQSELERLEASFDKREKLVRRRVKIKESLEKYLECVKIIDDTREMICAAYSKLRKDFSPMLSQKAGDIFSYVTNNPSDRIVVSEELSLSLNRNGSFYSVTNLSRATLDLLYFSFRIAAIDLIKETEGVPLFLDEAFVRYDGLRLESVLKYLSASPRQIIMTTFSQYEKSIVEKNIDYNLIEL